MGWGEKDESNNHVETHKFLEGRNFLFFARNDVICDLIIEILVLYFYGSNTAAHKLMKCIC